MLTLDLSEGWWLEDDGRDVLLTGPGGLEISLPSFAVSRLSHAETMPADETGTLREITWSYLLDPEPCPDSELRLSSTFDPQQSHAALHVLHLGTHTLWSLPDMVGWRLGGYFAMKQEGRDL